MIGEVGIEQDFFCCLKDGDSGLVFAFLLGTGPETAVLVAEDFIILVELVEEFLTDEWIERGHLFGIEARDEFIETLEFGSRDNVIYFLGDGEKHDVQLRVES